jgi:hypothetical protein
MNMKKVLSLILALVMAMTALTGIALAEAPEATEEEFDLTELLALLEGLGAEEGEDDGEEADLSAFLGMLGGILGEEEEAEEDEGAELGELLGLLGGIFGEEEEGEDEEADLSAFLGLLGGIFAEEEEPAEKSAPEAEEEIDLAGLLAMLGDLFGEEEAAAADYPKAESVEQFFGTWKLAKVTFFGEEVPLTENDNSTLTINEKGVWIDEVDDTETELVLKDGVLAFGDGEEDFIIIHLTETGVCFCLAGILDLDFVAAK